MSKIYRAFERSVTGAGDRLLLRKLKYSEWHAIRRKKPLYRDVKWTDEQKKEFDEFYIKHYGKKFPDMWTRLYESVNGVFCPQYFPEVLFSTKLERTLNPRKYAEVLSDKNLINMIYTDISGVRGIKAYVACFNGLLCDGENNQITPEEAARLLNDVGDCVVKPTTETGSGKGVRFLVLNGGRDEKTGDSVSDILKKYGKNFTVQEKLTEHLTYSDIHPASVNTIRLITYICGGEVCHIPLTMRVGTGGKEVDNIHAGGLCVGVSDDGVLKKNAYRLGYGDNNEKFTVHPDTGIAFEGYKLAKIPEMISVAKKMHLRTPQLGLVSWDFIVDDAGEIVLVEANLFNQSIWFPQIVNECAAFGKNTGKMLEIIGGK